MSEKNLTSFSRDPSVESALCGQNGSLCEPPIKGGLLEREIWVIPMLILSSVNVLVILTFEVYVICRTARDTPSRRHLFLGQMLLLGLLLGSSIGFAYAVEPNDFSCSAIRMGTGLSYGLIYSSLLVKLVFLISLNTGVYLPATYQALLFLFCILVQIVIGIQWLGSFPNSLCSFSTGEHVLSLLYVIFLVLFVASLAFKSRHYRDNYREAKYIGILMIFSLPVWILWILASVLLNEAFHSACEGFGLLFICTLTFVIMFLPKSRQLSAMGKEGIYIEDQLHHQDDRFSLHSGASDPYAPSFYHFKPFHGNKAPFNGAIVSPRASSAYKDYGSESPLYRSGNSYTGFHRPLRVVPPSATPTNSTQLQQQQQQQQQSQQLHNHHQPTRERDRRRSSSFTPPSPPAYTTQTRYFPSHFSPEKLYQYWQFYHPRLPGMYVHSALDPETYATLYDQERFKSMNPNVYFYKSLHHRHPGYIY